MPSKPENELKQKLIAAAEFVKEGAVYRHYKTLK